MSVIQDTWLALTPARRAGWLALVGALLAGFVWLGMRVLSPAYEVAFSRLRPQDAATITTELDKLKIAYQLDDSGATVRVPQAQVHTARMKVMGKELPLAGHVGFELFNNADLGLTEFAQRVNYQRALQGELSRTIMGLERVDSARVHLSMPEQGYLRRAGAKAKASVTLSTKDGAPLDSPALRSIQRLVAAAVPDLEPADVAVVHQSVGAEPGLHGSGGVAASGLHVDPRLDAKFELEAHYTRRILALADRWFGPGRTQVSVDLQLNFDQARVVNETTSAASRGDRAEAPRRVASAAAAAATEGGDNTVAVPAEAAGRRSSQRRVEEVTVAPGTVRQAHVGILVSGAVDKAELDRFRTLVLGAAALHPERGDSVALFNVDPARSAGAAPAAASTPDAAAEAFATQTTHPHNGAETTAVPRSTAARAPDSHTGWLAAALALAVGAALLALWFWMRLRVAGTGLPPQERAALARSLDELLRAREAA